MKTDHSLMPPRFTLPGTSVMIGLTCFILFFIYSLESVNLSLEDLVTGFPYMVRLVDEMMPPEFNRFGYVAQAMLVTFQMAVVGATIGIVASLFLSIFAARNLTPSPFVHHGTRSLIALFRTIPDLVWAVFFVATVGLGPFAGTLTIIVDTIGFCGRFFAEAMEEVEIGPQEALTAIGARKPGIICSAVLPAVFPSLTNSSLFSLEKAVRHSVVLGLVGAGGIGIELKVAMDMFLYSEAATIILSMFLLVFLVEQLSSRIRRKIL